MHELIWKKNIPSDERYAACVLDVCEPADVEKAPLFIFFHGGGLEVGLHVESGRITDVAFFGDFLAVSPLDDLKEALRGCVFRRAEVQAVLEGFPMRELFGGITETEVLDTIFYAGDA